MRLKVFLPLLMSAAATGVSAQTAVVTGSVVDADTGAPVAGATVTIPGQNITVVTGAAGDFRISNALPGEAVLKISAVRTTATTPCSCVFTTGSRCR